MILSKLLYLSLPLLLLTSCNKEEEKPKPTGLTSINSKHILDVCGLEANQVVKYQIFNDAKTLAEIKTNAKYQEKETYSSKIKVFYNTEEKKLVTYVKEQLRTILTTDFSYFTSLEEVKLSDSTESGSISILDSEAGKVDRGLFNSMPNLKKVDLTNFNFRKTTDLSSFFQEDTALTEVIFTGCKTENVTSLNSMFAKSGITSTAFSGLDTSTVLTFVGMFEGCTKLATVDLTSYNFKKALDFSDMLKMQVQKMLQLKNRLLM